MISILSSSPKASSDGTATPPEPDTYTFRGYRWTKWDDCGFPDRVNHAVSTDGRSAYAIGGFSGLGKSRGTMAVESWNDLGDVPLDVLKFNTDSSTWERLYPPREVQIHIPSPVNGEDAVSSEDYSRFLSGRYAHSCVCYKGKLYMYGGRNDYRFFVKVDCFDVESRTWSVLQTPSANIPAGRYAHGCTIRGSIMYIQGGTVLSGYALTYTDELISCNLESGLWQTEPVVPSETPLPLNRDFHSAVYVNERIVVFGGKCPLPHEDEDGFYEYLFGTHKWRRIKVTGYQPPGRRSLQGTAYGEKSIIYFGGFSTRKKIFYSDLFILDTDTEHVMRLRPYGLGPCPRRRVGMCLIGSDIVMCGGVGRNQSKARHAHSLMTFGDTYTLHLLPSLQHLCMEIIIRQELPIELLPVSIRQCINEMSSEIQIDCQPLRGDLYKQENI